MSDFADMHDSMAGLCRRIKDSDLANSLFGQQSMHDLSVYQVDFDYPAHHSLQYLKINPNFETREIEFRFIDTHFEQRQWSRVEPPETEVLVNRLVGFIYQVGWMN